jgi:hypothetical protein
MQTPQFTFSSRETEDDPRPRPALPGFVPPDVCQSFPGMNIDVTKLNLTR